MNIKKKVLSFLTASACTIGFLSGSLSVSAEYESDWMSADDFYYTYVDEDEDGNYDFVRIIGGEAETITIPETVDDLVVKEVNGGLMSENIEVSENNPYFCTIDGVLFDTSVTKLIAYPTARTDTSYTVPDTVTEIGNAAFYNSNLEEIILPESLVSIGNSAFGYNRNLVGIAIPDTVEYIGDEAFRYCETITEVNLPQGLASIGSEAFYCCYSLETITIPDTVTSIGSYAFSHTAVTEITLPSALTEISYGLFSQCENLTDITIPDTVTTIGEHAFAGTAITEITLPSSLTGISNGLFDECWLLTDITIPDTVTEIGDYAFYGCSALSDIEIPDSVTSVGEKAFYNTPLIEIQEDKLLYYVDSWLVYFDDYYTADTVSIADGTVGIADSIFRDCGSVVGVEIPEGVKYIGDFAFAESSISYVVLPETLVSIGEYAFSECESMTEIVIPDSVTEIGEYAFYNCDALNTAVLSSNLTAIRSNAFAYCDSLTEINIPESVIEIGEYAFYYCDVLERIVINNPECEIYDGYETISNWNNGTIYGYINSTAYTYAKAYEWNFEWLDENIVYGDANLDGVLNIRDSAYLAKSIAEGTISEYDLYADYNGDESVTIRDAAAVANNVAYELLANKGGEKIQREDNPSANISIGTAETMAGDYIEIPVKINAGNNFESAAFLIEWSEELGDLYYEVYTYGSASVEYECDGNACSIAAYCTEPIEDGTIATLSFYVPYNAKAGIYEINCTAIDTFALHDGEDLAASASVTNGSVTVLPEIPYNLVVKEGESVEISSDYDMFTVVSEDNTVAKVVGNVLEGIKAGETVLHFVTESGKSFESTAAVMPTENIEIRVDEQKYINVPLYHNRWFVSDDTVAYINSNGVLTGKSEGTTKIYAVDTYGETVYVGYVTVKEKTVTTVAASSPTTTTAATFKTVVVTSVEAVQKDYVDADMPTPSIYLSKINGKPGETVTVYVKVKCNNNFEAVDTWIRWDDDELESSSAYGCNGVSVASSNGNGYCSLVAYNDDPVADGAVAAIDFTIPENAPAGKEYTLYFTDMSVFYEFGGDDYADTVETFSGSVKTGSMVSEKLVLNEGQSIGLAGESSKYKIISKNESIAKVENNILYGVESGETYLYFIKDNKTFAVPVSVTVGDSCVIDIYDSRNLDFDYDGSLVWLSENVSVAEASYGYVYANKPGTVKVYALDKATGRRVYECNVTVVGEVAVTTSTSSSVTTTTTTTTVSRGTALISLTTGTTPAPVTAPADHIDAEMPNPSVYISNVGGEAGETVKVDVKVKCNNNFGMLYAGTIGWWYDYGLTLKSVIPYSDDITVVSEIDNSNCCCYITAFSNVEGFADGTIATLEFEIPADAELENVYNISFDSLEYMTEYGSEESVPGWSTVSGSITVTGNYEYEIKPAPPYEITVEEGYTIMFSDDFKDFEVFIDDYELEKQDGNVVSAVYDGYAAIYLVNDIINYVVNVTINPVAPPTEFTVREREYEDIDLAINDYNYTWLSDNQEVAQVDSDGWVYGISIGTANIYAVDKETGEIAYTGKVTVTEGVAETTAVTSGSPTVTTVTTVSTTISGTGTPDTENPSDGLRGDANLDGKVNVRDAATVAGALAKKITDTLPQLADYNNDGQINVRDAAAIAGYLANAHK